MRALSTAPKSSVSNRKVPMLSSVKSRIVFGFGIVMALLIAATVANLTMVSGISSGFDQFQAALNRKTQAIDIDLVMTKVRVRVNQWLRNPSAPAALNFAT